MFVSTVLLLPMAALAAAECAADNCLRALVATQTPEHLNSAQAFCRTFTATSVASTEIPSFASDHCAGFSPDDFSTRLSSACSCVAAETAPVTSEPTSTSTTCSSPTKTEESTGSFTTVVRPSTTSQTGGEDSTKTACAVVSSSWAAQLSSRIPVPTVEAKLAHDCLRSVPLHKEAAIQLVDSIRPYVEWQSDLPYLKSPPKDYEPGPFDIIGHLEKIRGNLATDKYNGELAFQQDLFAMTAQVRDGHFQFMPDALTGVFEYLRPFGLASYSKDPVSLPVIKKWEEVGAKQDAARVITRLNGVDASDFVQGIVELASGNQDMDAAYNAMFFSRAKLNVGSVSGLFRAGGWHKYLYPGENTTAEFETGEVESAVNTALVKANFEGVTDGESFYRKFCAGKPSSVGPAAQGSTMEAIQLPGYPQPVLRSADDKVSGYYLQGDGVNDVAVLYISGFDPRSPRVFQKTVELFLQECKMAGKSKIIIDLQMNGGGYVLQGIDLFRQFFPNIEQDGLSRWRENDQFLALAKIVSDAGENIDARTTPSNEAVMLSQSWWNYRYDLNVSGKPFESFDAKYAPQMSAGDPYTALLRWDLENSLTTVNETFGLGIDITGYGSRRSFTQPFEIENIVLLTDGFCASTCSIFASQMQIPGKVKTVTFGGRPTKKPIQAVGGVKGAQVLRYGDIWNMTQQVLSSELAVVSEEQSASLSQLSDLPSRRSTEARLNVRDQILRGNVADGIPAQFVNEPADCRLFWTLPMLGDVTEVWKAAANAAWNGAGCAVGAGFDNGGIRPRPMAGVAEQPSREPIVISAADVEPEHQVSELQLEKHNQKVHIL